MSEEIPQWAESIRQGRFADSERELGAAVADHISAQAQAQWVQQEEARILSQAGPNGMFGDYVALPATRALHAQIQQGRIRSAAEGVQAFEKLVKDEVGRVQDALFRASHNLSETPSEGQVRNYVQARMGRVQELKEHGQFINELAGRRDDGRR